MFCVMVPELHPDTRFPGCFLISTPDICFDSKETGYSYCWCSTKDLCNAASLPLLLPLLLPLTLLFPLLPFLPL